MTPRDFEKIWKPLRTTKAKGLGLGLASCKPAVEAHGGSISFGSRIGRGTTFMTILPIRADMEEWHRNGRSS